MYIAPRATPWRFHGPSALVNGVHRRPSTIWGALIGRLSSFVQHLPVYSVPADTPKTSLSLGVYESYRSLLFNIDQLLVNADS